jgi:hypothetical protein
MNPLLPLYIILGLFAFIFLFSLLGALGLSRPKAPSSWNGWGNTRTLEAGFTS